jgi:Uma2 family endonuclease
MPVTVQEFLDLPELEDQRIELICGEVVGIGRGRIPHEVVKSNVAQILIVWLIQNPMGVRYSAIRCFNWMSGTA